MSIITEPFQNGTGCPEFESIPQELRDVPQWVVHRRKQPRDPTNVSVAASVSDPRTWGTYEQALTASASSRCDGIGFVFTDGDPYVGIDLDDCFDPATGNLKESAREIVDRIDSYTERSVSGTGLHVIARGSPPPRGRHPHGLGIFATARYFTVTGNVFEGRDTIYDRDRELSDLYADRFGDSADTGGNGTGFSGKRSPTLTDEEILEKAQASRTGEAFRRLWSGDTSAHGNDQSKADLALLRRMAFYTQDREQLDRLFRQSQLFRDKWERSSYREPTLTRALENLGNVYQQDLGPDATTPSVRIVDRTKDHRGGRQAERPDGASQAAPNGRVVTSYAEIPMRAVDWLWTNYVPLGKLTELIGDPGLGKSTIAIDLAARVSTGRSMPGVPEGERGTDLTESAGVMILSTEDDPEDTIKPRLVASGGDPARVFEMKLQTTDSGVMQLTIPDDLDHVRATIEERGIKLVILDPLVAYLGGKTDAHRDQDVRRALGPLSGLAADLGIAVLSIRHMNKNDQVNNVLYRGGGSIGITAQARSVLFVSAQQQDDRVADTVGLDHERGPNGERLKPAHVLAVGKNNLAVIERSFLYRVASVVVGQDPESGKDIVGSHIQWVGRSEVTANQLLMKAPEVSGRQKEYRDFLHHLLKDGPVPAQEVQRACEEAGIKWNTLNSRRVKERIGVHSFQERDGSTIGRWMWALNGPDGEHAGEQPQGPQHESSDDDREGG